MGFQRVVLGDAVLTLNPHLRKMPTSQSSQLANLCQIQTCLPIAAKKGPDVPIKYVAASVVFEDLARDCLHG